MVTREDEYLQASAAGTGVWNDSHTFGLIDRNSGTEVSMRIGYLPNQKRAHVLVIVAPRKGATYQWIDWDLPLPESSIDDLQLGIAHVQMLEPLNTFRLRAKDDQLSIDVHWRAVRPPLDLGGGGVSRETPTRKGYSQAGSVDGELELAGRRQKIQGYGFRSRACGERDFSNIARYRSAQAQIGDDFSFMIGKYTFFDGKEMTSGYVLDGETMRRVSQMSGEMGGLAYGAKRSMHLKIQDSDGKDYAFTLHSVTDYSWPFGPLVCLHDVCRIDSERGTGYASFEDALGRPAEI